MSPEERAAAIMNVQRTVEAAAQTGLDAATVSDIRNQLTKVAAEIASAIREAEASARNEALEEAAARCEWFASQQMVPPISTYVEGRRDAGEALAGHILNLKSKQEG